MALVAMFAFLSVKPLSRDILKASHSVRAGFKEDLYKKVRYPERGIVFI